LPASDLSFTRKQRSPPRKLVARALLEALGCAVGLGLPLAIACSASGRLVGEGGLLSDRVVWTAVFVAVPALVFAGPVVEVRVRRGLRVFVGSAPDDEKGAQIEPAFERLRRWRDSPVEWGLAAIAFAAAWGRMSVLTDFELSSWRMHASNGVVRPSPAGWWLYLVVTPFVFFATLRWGWRLLLLTRLFRDLSRTIRTSAALHPDGAAGLGRLTRAQGSFAVVSFALGAIVAASFANQAAHHDVPAARYESLVAVFVAATAALFVVPAFALVPALHRVQREAELQYAAAAGAMARQYEAQVLVPGDRVDLSVVGAAVSAKTDLLHDYRAVERLRRMPVSRATLLELVLGAVIPFAFFFGEEWKVPEMLREIGKRLLLP
jgi:hypothetical protein